MSSQKKISLKITQASMNQTALDWPRNMANIYAAIDEAVAQDSDILALEELALTGYEVNDDFQRTDNARILAALEDVAAYAEALDSNLIVSIGHPWRLQMRDIPSVPRQEFERVKEPVYDRLNLPFNVQSIISHGTIHAMTAKTNLFNDERGYEKRYFNEWSMAAADRIGGIYGTIHTSLTEGGCDIPFGAPILCVTNGKRSFNLAQAICETKWVATRYDGHPHDDSRYETDNVIPSISRHLGSKNGLVLVIPNASPPARDKIDKHIHLDALASRYADVVIDTDGLGSSGSTFAQFGHRLVVQRGRVLSYGSRMNFNRVATTTTTVRLSSAPAETYANVHAEIPHAFKKQPAQVVKSLAYDHDPGQAWDSPKNPDRHYEEVIRYTAFWLFDYMRKTGSRGVMEALSGGADSGFNSTIVAVMAHMGIHELGAEKFCDELNLRNKAEIIAAEKADGKNAAIKECMQHMLTCVYMGTNNSSSETRQAAEFLIKGGVDPATGAEIQGIGGKFVNRNVQDLLDFYGTMYAVESINDMAPLQKHQIISDISAYLNANPHTTSPEDLAEMAAALKKKYPQIDDLVTAADGVAYENIQARGREVLIMLFANKEGKMAVANPNLDEARNAYATFGGDLHSGTINLNMHLDKDYQLAVMRYLFENGVCGVMPPVRALGQILKNKPTAELQPKSADGKVVQNDEDAMQRSFRQMNFISECMLHKRRHEDGGARRLNAMEVFSECQASNLFTGIDENTLYNMVRMSYERWAIAQHKIHASPIGPTFGRNVDHQTSLRTPNVSGQAKDELTLLGIQLLFLWANDDGVAWENVDKKLLERRAWQDESFVKTFGQRVISQTAGKNFDLRRLYCDVKEHGWDKIFGRLEDDNPSMVVHKLSLGLG